MNGHLSTNCTKVGLSRAAQVVFYNLSMDGGVGPKTIISASQNKPIGTKPNSPGTGPRETASKSNSPP
jgi:hypothetical protein